MSHYYNEFDPFAAAWLRKLIAWELIPDGYVDERSIEDVKPHEVDGYTQCHWFAGIGGWPLALQLAGWPTDRPVWTGSPPCQPFSSAGRQDGYDDARHLAPKWLELVDQCRPPAVIGEQVASAASSTKHPWLDDLQDALEAKDYATGAIVLPACSVGSPHIRQRIVFVAQWVGDGQQSGLEGHSGHGDRSGQPGRVAQDACGSVAEAGAVGGLADDTSERRRGRPADTEWQAGRNGAEVSGSGCGMADAEYAQRRPLSEHRQDGHNRPDTRGQEAHCEFGARSEIFKVGGQRCPGSTSNSQWSASDWLHCRDGKWRPVEPGTFPLADGVPARVGRLRGYGNAIVPQAAAEVVIAFMTTLKETNHA